MHCYYGVRTKKFILTHLLFFKATLALGLGIMLADIFGYRRGWIGILILGILLVLGYYFFKIKRSKLADFSFFLLLVLLGFGLHSFYFLHPIECTEKALKPYNQESLNYIVRIDSRPEVKAKSFKVRAKLIHSPWISSSNIKDVLLYFPKDDRTIDSLHYGDILQISSKLASPSASHYDFEFDYKTWLYRHGVIATGYVSQWQKMDYDSSLFYRVRKAPWLIRDYFESKLETYISDTSTLPIAKALLIGVQRDIDPDLYQAYANTGTIHILSISGLHFGILIMYLGKLLSLFIHNERLKFGIKHSISFMYALITGFSPPIFRSFIMFLGFDLQHFSRVKSSGLNVLFLSAFILLLYNSNQLFDIGFQLSYIALIGIMLWTPAMNQAIEFNYKKLTKIWQIFTTMLAAWVWTFPFIALYFHQASLLGMLSNFLIIPCTVYMMIVGFILLLVSPFPFLGYFFGLIFSYAILFQNYIVKLFGTIPFATLKDIYISSNDFLFLWIILLFINLFFFSKQKQDFRILVVLIAIFLIFYPLEFYYRKSHPDYYLSSNFKSTTQAFPYKDTLYIIGDNVEPNTEKYFLLPLRLKYGIDSKNRVYLGSNSYFDKNLYSINPEVNSQYYLLSRENKRHWYRMIQSQDSFMIMPSVNSYHVKKLEDSLIKYQRYYKRF